MSRSRPSVVGVASRWVGLNLSIGILCWGCSDPCLLPEPQVVNHATVRVLDRSGRRSASAEVKIARGRCTLDRRVADQPFYECYTGPGDVEIEATLDGRRASTTIESTSETCGGEDLTPDATVDLMP